MPRTVPSEVTVTSTPTTTTTSANLSADLRLDIGGVPVDIFNAFSLPMNLPEKQVGKLKDIYNWSKIGLDEPTMGNSLNKIRNLEMRLGSADIGESKMNKLWNWIRMDMTMYDLKNRQRSLER